MSSERHERITSLLREMAASFIQHEANANPLITVTHVSTSPDYRKATIFFTTIPDGGEQDALIFLKRSASDLRQFIKKKSDLKIIPHLEFMIDAGERHRQHTDKVFRDIESN